MKHGRSVRIAALDQVKSIPKNAHAIHTKAASIARNTSRTRASRTANISEMINDKTDRFTIRHFAPRHERTGCGAYQIGSTLWRPFSILCRRDIGAIGRYLSWYLQDYNHTGR